MESESDCESLDSDRELQVAFQTGLLGTGLSIAAKVPEKKHINDVEGLKIAIGKLQESKTNLPWIERLDLTVEPAPAAAPLEEQLSATMDGDDVHDDFKREINFYRLAQAAVLEAIPRLHSMGIPTKRPEDYFAEMVKSDIHMKKVREKLLSKQVSMERSTKAKKMRELRKYGKKVQHEVLQKRQKEKKEMMAQVKKYRKGQTDRLDFLDDKKQQAGKKDNQSNKTFQPNKKRDLKNKKYGHGGQKKRSKHNTAQSASEMGDYSVKKHGSAPAQHRNKNKKNVSKHKVGGKKRLGKQRRQNMKSKTK